MADLLLQLAIEIDQEIAAGDQIDAGERRILEQAVAGEQHDVAQFLADPVVVALADEEPTQPLLG